MSAVAHASAVMQSGATTVFIEEQLRALVSDAGSGKGGSGAKGSVQAGSIPMPPAGTGS